MEPENSEESMAKELERLAVEQLNEKDEEEPSQDQARARRRRVLQIYGQGGVRTAEDHYHAALVLLYGEDVSHYDLARTLAKHAAELGEARAWSVIAAAWDRSLIQRGQPQRFGTQFIREQGRLSLGEVDPAMTDAKRALYGVPPLWVQRQTLERLRRREENL